MKYLNKDRIIGADILPPYENSGESWDFTNTSGWQVCFLVGYRDGHPDYIIVEKETEAECIKCVLKFQLEPL